MSKITLGGNPINTNGSLPEKGTKAPAFELTNVGMDQVGLASIEGRKILNIFPSVDTGVCATSVRKFNESATKLDNVKVLCVSNDLPFAMKRFCGAEGIENVMMLSGFRSDFAEKYGVLIQDSGFKGLMARAVVVLDEKNNVIYTELVPEIAQEPDYDAALKSLG